MRLDFVTIFPDYFKALELSLIGKAVEKGLLSFGVHDLRDWTEDKHRTVDDTPYGGGAGMVMRPDVWGRAIDEVIAAAPLAAESRRVLAIPTPAGRPFTQRIAEDLVNADQIIFACGRYEGIDQRVADYYESTGVEVLQFSIGDYVLNGGEVASLVVAEAVGRLCDGVVGNPQSLVEESHSDAGLLEYPAYTRPENWRDLDVPDVLRSGNHAAIERWRTTQSLIRTAQRRPDLVKELQGQVLETWQREVLATHGHVLHPRYAPLTIRVAGEDDAASVSALAVATFPDACPPHLPKEAIDAFIQAELQEENFARYLADPERYRILIASVPAVQSKGDKEEVVAYTLTIIGEGALPHGMLKKGKEEGAAYLSKCYLSASWRGSGIAGALLEAAVEDVVAHSDATQIVLGTNIGNKQSTAFYKKHAFVIAGRRHFDVGGVDNIDNVLVRKITRG